MPIICILCTLYLKRGLTQSHMTAPSPPTQNFIPTPMHGRDNPTGQTHGSDSFSGLPHLQFLITCSMQREGEDLENLITRSVAWPSDIITHSTAKWYMRPILHSVLAMKMGQVLTESYNECMKHTQAKSPDSKRLMSDKCENTQLQTWICFIGRNWLVLVL